jgi:hypothetical protein
MSKYRLVVELDVELHDAEWTEQTLLENAPHFFIDAIMRAEARNRANFPNMPEVYTCDVDDLTVWTREGYIADLKEGEIT